jgi:uncharacterized damage-inducible protein DinB
MKVSNLCILALLVVSVHSAHAQHEPRMPASLRAGLLARFDEASGKIGQLAETFPTDKYGWRPGPGVRSVSEVLVHVGMGNYYTTDGAGVKLPFKLKEDEETSITTKPEAIEFLKRSTDHMRKALSRLTDADLQRPAMMFDQKTTVGNVYLFGITHLHEHLGQLVSYARMNGVVPPWSAPSSK